MRILSALFIVLCLVSCHTKDMVNTDTKVDNLQKEKSHLAHVKFTNAIQVYGEPQISNKLKVEEKTLTADQLALVNIHFPNKEYESQKVYFLEAQWKRPANTKLTVWYLFIKNEWKPIEVLANS